MRTLFFLLVVAWASSANAFTFKGITPGEPLDDPEERYFCRAEKSTLSDAICILKSNQRETIAGASAESVIVYMINSKVGSVRIHFKSDDFDDVKTALTTKYGPGDSSFRMLTNAVGVQFQNELITWKSIDRWMALQRYAGNVRSGRLIIRSSEAMREFLERAEAQEKQNAEDL